MNWYRKRKQDYQKKRLLKKLNKARKKTENALEERLTEHDMKLTQLNELRAEVLCDIKLETIPPNKKETDKEVLINALEQSVGREKATLIVEDILN